MDYIIDWQIFEDHSWADYPCSVEDILNQVREEYETGIDFSRRKRDLFENRMKLYSNVSDTENKVYIRLLFSVMQTLMSLYYTDVPTAKFYGRTLGDEDLAENINNVAKFDYTEMDLNKKKYQVQRDRLFYGTGIELYEWRDEDRNVPLMKVMNPMTWVCDPYSYLWWDERFHGFELEVNLDDLKIDEWFFNQDVLMGKALEDLNKNARDAVASVRKLWEIEFNKLKKQNIYYHYTIIKGRKYLVCTDYSRSIILKFEEIQPANKVQKKNPSLVKFPVVVRHWSPLYWDPYGVSLPDIMEDKQMMIQLFMNLNRIKAEHEARGDMFFYDEDVIKDINQLQIPTQWPKFIKANLRQNPNPIMEVPRNSIKSDAYNMPQVLQHQATLDLGLDPTTMGVAANQSMTATQNQTIQKNANLRMILGSKIDWRAEKDFREMRYSFYQINFKWEKAFRLGSALGSNYFNLKRDQFITDSDIDVDVLTESQISDKMEKEKNGLMMLYADITQNPLSSDFSKNFTRRRVLKLNWVPDDVIMAMIPETVEEINARQDVELINWGEDIKPITNINEDHRTYLVIYDKAVDNEHKFRAVEARKQAMVLSGQSMIDPNQQLWGWNPMNQTQAMITNQAMQQDSMKVASNQNIAAGQQV
jgi:hypothetical protein